MSQVAFGQMNQVQFSNVSRFSGGTQYAPIDSGSDAYEGKRTVRGANNGNFIGTVLTVAAVGVAAVAGMALTKKLFTPAILKNITSLRAVTNEAGAAVNGSLKFTSEVAGKEAAGTLNYIEKSGFLGMFKKAEIIVDGGATQTVRMWRVPGEVGNVLKKGLDAFGSPLYGWQKVATEGVKLGEQSLPIGAATTTNALGQTVGVVKNAANDFVIHFPGGEAGAYITKPISWSELPANLRSLFIKG